MLSGQWARARTLLILCCGPAALAVTAATATAQFPRGGGGGGGHRHQQHANAAPVDSSAIPQPERKTGCAAFDIRLDGGALTTVGRSAGLPCGPIEPILMGPATFDTVHRVLTIPMALVNHGIDRLHTPAALLAPRSALVVTAGAPPPPPVDTSHPTPPVAQPATPAPPPANPPTPGTVVLVGGASPLALQATAGGAHGAAPAEAVHFVGMDAALPDTGEEGPAPTRWSFDKLLVRQGHDPVIADDGTTVLQAGDTSASRAISIAVPKGVTGFRVSLQGVGTYVFTVPLRAPTTVSRDEEEDSRAPDNILTNVPGLPGHVVRNKLWVMFRSDASPELRQAAIDSVNAVVVGGMLRGNDRYYYLRITANPDSGAAPLERALRVLAPMPQVQDVMPDRLP